MSGARDGAAAIEVTGLVKRYGDRTALDGISFEVARGEVFGLLGPNGAGKTSAVEILEGHRPRTSGTVRVLGADPATAGRAWRDRIGIVPQNCTDHGYWRVGELAAQIAGCYRDPVPVGELLDLVGLGDLSRRLVATLSGGQRRRLDVALALAGRPALLFLDEPTTGFAPEARRELWSVVERLKEAGTSVLLTTHYLDEAERLADRVAVLRAGRIISVSSPQDLGSADAGTEISWREGGRTRRTRTHDVPGFLAGLQARLGDDVPELEVRRPSLEDRYLQLIDHEPGSTGT
ncbi:MULTISPECIES: ABC transporter ATP-binding protein [Streptomyces]|uniref:ABC transporter ATP-binding protein n=1 Tax=Streptomyces TaxID=1883 RepID=UPI000F6BF88C|nr:ABC transporter ATP-binding protein [Streptomyces sp. W1SF4]AZM93695.1 ABC transporter ATP-binding protein [Streptomyces sp. W1SF4]